MGKRLQKRKISLFSEYTLDDITNELYQQLSKKDILRMIKKLNSLFDSYDFSVKIYKYNKKMQKEDDAVVRSEVKEKKLTKEYEKSFQEDPSTQLPLCDKTYNGRPCIARIPHHTIHYFNYPKTNNLVVQILYDNNEEIRYLTIIERTQAQNHI